MGGGRGETQILPPRQLLLPHQLPLETASKVHRLWLSETQIWGTDSSGPSALILSKELYRKGAWEDTGLPEAPVSVSTGHPS